MGKDVSTFCRRSQQCMRSKVTSTTHTPVQHIEIPVKRFSHVLHIDILGPLPAISSGFSHLFTTVDRSTRWSEVVPLHGTSTADCVEDFLSGWVGRLGVLGMVTSDMGAQFTSAVWQAMCYQLGFHHKFTMAYHCQANGMMERFHRQLKASLRAHLDNQDWLAHHGLGASGVAGGSKGGFGCIFCGDGLWDTTHPSGRVLGLSRTTAGLVSTRPQGGHVRFPASHCPEVQ
jgi:hypothetical protein